MACCGGGEDSENSAPQGPAEPRDLLPSHQTYISGHELLPVIHVVHGDDALATEVVVVGVHRQKQHVWGTRGREGGGQLSSSALLLPLIPVWWVLGARLAGDSRDLSRLCTWSFFHSYAQGFSFFMSLGKEPWPLHLTHLLTLAHSHPSDPDPMLGAQVQGGSDSALKGLAREVSQAQIEPYSLLSAGENLSNLRTAGKTT